MAQEWFSGDIVLHDQEHTTHVSLMLGARSSSFGNTFAEVMASQRSDYIAFIVCAQPKVPVWPHTVYVNKNAYESEEHGALHWGPGHVGVAAGLMDGVREGVLTEEQARELLCVAVVWIWPTAYDLDRVCLRTREATYGTLVQAMRGEPGPSAVEATVQANGIANPYYTLSAADVTTRPETE